MKSPQMIKEELDKFNEAHKMYEQGLKHLDNDDIYMALSLFEKSVETYRPHAKNVLYHAICVFSILNQEGDINLNINTMSTKNIKLSKEMLDNLDSITNILRNKLGM